MVDSFPCADHTSLMDLDMDLSPPPLLLALQNPVLITASQPTSSPPLYLTNIDHINKYVSDKVVFFGPSPQTSDQDIAEVVKRALPKLLLHYHWIAGRLRYNEDGRLEVDCNGKGVMFVSGTADATIAELGDTIRTPDPIVDSLVPRLPAEAFKDDLSRCPLLIIQVIRFNCGGFALATVYNHMLFDGYTIALFLNNLGSIARGKGLVTAPSVSRECMMPRDPPSPTFDHGRELLLRPEESVPGAPRMQSTGAKRYTKHTFPEEMLERLRSEALSGKRLSKCTLYKALAAQIWVAKARTCEGLGPSEEFLLRAVVDMRRRVRPALQEGYVGNMSFPAIAIATIKELTENPLCFAVERIQEAIAKMTGEYLQSVLDFMQLHRDVFAVNTRAPGVWIISWDRLPYYDIDLGSGPPLYFCMSGIHSGISGTFRITPEARCTRSMGAFVFMDEHESDRFRAAAQLHEGAPCHEGHQVGCILPDSRARF